MSRSNARLLFVLSAALAVVAVPSCRRNLPPDAPPISGPQLGYVNIDYTYSMTSTDPNGDSVSYQMDWGDGTTSAWSSFVANAATVTLTKSWSTARNHFSVKARAKDRREATSSWTPEYPVIIMPNAPPDTPAAPSGPNSGYVGRYYSFYVSTSDPDGDSVSYQFNWAEVRTTQRHGATLFPAVTATWILSPGRPRACIWSRHGPRTQRALPLPGRHHARRSWRWTE